MCTAPCGSPRSSCASFWKAVENMASTTRLWPYDALASGETKSGAMLLCSSCMRGKGTRHDVISFRSMFSGPSKRMLAVRLVSCK